MVFNSGTGITDHIDMLNKLVEVVTSRALTGVAINAGGTGHAIGDIIEIDATGATSTIVAQLEVTSVSGGVIDGIRIYRGGAYTVDPTTTTGNAQSGTSGAGISSTFDLTFSAASWSVNRRTQQAASATIGTGGTGYTVNDQITLSDVGAIHGAVDASGTQGSAAVFNVDSVSGGVITGVSVVSGSVGNYEEVPANDIGVTGGTGNDDAELTVTWEDATFAENLWQVCMLEGSGLAGADEIHCVIKPYTDTNGFDDVFNWALMATTGYNAGLPLHTQAGINNTGAGLQINSTNGAMPVSNHIGSYVVLKDDDADPDMEWWINHNGRRIIMVVKVEGSSTVAYSSCYMGFLNQFGTDTEYPYPICVMAGTSLQDAIWTESSLLHGGITEPIFNSTSADPLGPVFVRTASGSWSGHCAAQSSTASSRVIEDENCVYPFWDRRDSLAQRDENTQIGQLSFADAVGNMIDNSGVTGIPDFQLKPTPGTGDDYYWLVAPMLTKADDSVGFPDGYFLYGEVDGVFWFHTGNNTIVSEDRFVLTTKRYTIFQNGNRTRVWSYFALDED